jgi:tRNA dimethylallyltransferase
MKGCMTIEEAAEEVKKASRHYAKRQLTWFRRNKNIHWLTRTPDTEPEEILERARQLTVNTDK